MSYSIGPVVSNRGRIAVHSSAGSFLGLRRAMEKRRQAQPPQDIEEILRRRKERILLEEAVQDWT